MNSEGRGIVAPQSVVVTHSISELRLLLREAETRASYRCYRKKQDQWSLGLKGDLTVEGLGRIRSDVRSVFCGLFGEDAVCKFINKHVPTARARVDFKLRERGDFGLDVHVFGWRLQVKTRQNESRTTLVRRVKENGTVDRFHSDALVCCEWLGAPHVRLLGWCMRTFVEQQPHVSSPVGRWLNAEIHDRDLSPMSSAIDEIEARRIAYRQEGMAWR